MTEVFLSALVRLDTWFWVQFWSGGVLEANGAIRLSWDMLSRPRRACMRAGVLTSKVLARYGVRGGLCLLGSGRVQYREAGGEWTSM